MKVSAILAMLHMLSEGFSVVDFGETTDTETVTEGENFTEHCLFYIPGNKKIFCKNDCDEEDVLVETTENTAVNGRFRVSFEKNGISSPDKMSVSITEVQLSDSGRYQCKLDRWIKDGSVKFSIKVIAAPAPPAPEPGPSPGPDENSETSAPLPADGDSSATTGPLLFVCLAVVLILLLITVILIILYKKKKKKTKDKSKDLSMNAKLSVPEEDTVQYSEVQFNKGAPHSQPEAVLYSTVLDSVSAERSLYSNVSNRQKP